MRERVLTSMLVIVLSACGSGCGGGLMAPNSSLQSWESPDEGFRIGRGYDPDATDKIRGDCLINPEQYTASSWVDAQGIKATLAETRITSFESLLKELNISMSTSGQYTFYSGSASYSKYEKFKASEDTFTWLFKVSAEVGSKTLMTENLRLGAFKPEAKALIEQARSGNIEAKKSFQRMCGTQFVRSVRLGGHITDVLEISSKASSVINEVHASTSAAGGGSVWRASASVSFGSLLEQASRSNMLKRELDQAGGEKINYNMSPDNVQDTLDQFARALNNKNATVISVELIDWDTVIDFTPNSITDVARRIRLEALLKDLWRSREKLDKIDTLIYRYEKGEIQLNDAEIAGLRSSYEQVTSYLDQVTQQGQNCYADATKCGVALAPVVVNFPPIRPIATSGCVFATSKWKITYAFPTTNFVSFTSGSVTTWSSDDLISASLAGGDMVQLRTELMELNCASISGLLQKYGPTVLKSDRGEPLHYTERVADYPGGRQTMLSFGYREGNDCLLLQMFSEKPTSVGISLSDDSDAARLARRMAQSVRYNH